MSNSICPTCNTSEKQVKAGLNRSGSQRMLCNLCKHRYTPMPKESGYPIEMHQQAVEMYVDGTNFRAIARRLKVNHQTVINWINAYSTRIPDTAPVMEGPIETAELDELFTFVGEKKTKFIL